MCDAKLAKWAMCLVAAGVLAVGVLAVGPVMTGGTTHTVTDSVLTDDASAQADPGVTVGPSQADYLWN